MCVCVCAYLNIHTYVIHTYVYVFFPGSAQLWQNTEHLDQTLPHLRGIWTKSMRVSMMVLQRRILGPIFRGGFKYFYPWGNDPIWQIFFRWVETTNYQNAGNLKSLLVPPDGGDVEWTYRTVTLIMPGLKPRLCLVSGLAANQACDCAGDQAESPQRHWGSSLDGRYSPFGWMGMKRRMDDSFPTHFLLSHCHLWGFINGLRTLKCCFLHGHPQSPPLFMLSLRKARQTWFQISSGRVLLWCQLAD